MITDTCPFCGGPSRMAVQLPQHRIIACRRCQIARTDPAPIPVNYDEQNFHAIFNHRTADDLPTTWRQGLHQQRDLLLRHLPPGARVLEIGCGQGLLLGLLAAAGFQAEGIEPSHSATAAAVSVGLQVEQGYFTAATAPRGPFDAVVVSHVLEHIETPEPFLKAVAQIAPGGLLLLVQANWRGWVPRKTKSLWHAWAEGHHYWHFTPAGLTRWLQHLGMTRVELEYSSLEHGGYWLARLASWYPGASDQFQLLMRLPNRPPPV